MPPPHCARAQCMRPDFARRIPWTVVRKCAPSIAPLGTCTATGDNIRYRKNGQVVDRSVAQVGHLLQLFPLDKKLIKKNFMRSVKPRVEVAARVASQWGGKPAIREFPASANSFQR